MHSIIASAYHDLAKRALARLPFSAQCDMLQDEIVAAIRFDDDVRGVSLIELLEQLHLQQRAPAKSGQESSIDKLARELLARVELRSKLYTLYWKFFETMYTGAKYETPRLFETRMLICRKIAEAWHSDKNAKSKKAFRFLAAAHSPLSPACPSYPEESLSEQASRGKVSMAEDRKRIEQIIREQTEKSGFRVDHYEAWLNEPHVPEGIQKVLVIGRARCGGVQLARSDMDNAWLVRLLGIPSHALSPQALAYAASVTNGIALMDTLTRQLVEEIRQKCVYGATLSNLPMTYDFEGPKRIKLVYTLAADTARHKVNKALAEIYRYVREWLAKQAADDYSCYAVRVQTMVGRQIVCDAGDEALRGKA